MAGIRDIKRASRQALHDQLAVPALYIAATGAEPVPVAVRVHARGDMVGQLNGSAQWGERAETEPHIIFQASELPGTPTPRPPRNGAIVSVETGEAYTVEFSHPVDDAGFIRSRVVKIPTADTADLPVPESEDDE